jgi:hypothetical protein
MAKKSGRKAPARRRRDFIPPTVAAKWAPFKAICSECYEEFVVIPKPDLETIVCPECDHGAKAPSEEFLRKWTFHKKQESKKLIIAIIAFGIIFVLGLVWLLLMVNPTYKDSQEMHYAFLGIMIVMAAVVLYFGGTYEGNRYEAYF